MVVLSLLESVKDTASRLLPSSYKEILEEATQPHLPTVPEERILFLCSSANIGANEAADVIRAVRRRITDSDAKVQYLTVLVLDTLVRRCDVHLHLEVASQKGLLRDLENIATRRPCITEKEIMAKNAALALILNMSVWFTGHPDARLYILTTVSDDVRHALGSRAFDGIYPDMNAEILFSSHHHQQHQRGDFVPQPRRSRQRHHFHPSRSQLQGPVVDAVGINFPKEEELTAMLDCCMTLAEYLNNAKVLEDGSREMDDVISGFWTKIVADQGLLTLLLSSDIKLDNRDVLRDISNSQSAIIRRLESEVRSGPSRPTAPQADTRVAQGDVPFSSSAPSNDATVAKAPENVSNAPGEAKEGMKSPPPQTTSATFDDIFGIPHTAQAPEPPHNNTTAEQAVDVAPLLPGEREVEQQRPQPPEAKQEELANEEEGEKGKEMEEGQGKQRNEEDQLLQLQAPQQLHTDPCATVDDDFDAFLNGRLS